MLINVEAQTYIEFTPHEGTPYHRRVEAGRVGCRRTEYGVVLHVVGDVLAAGVEREVAGAVAYLRIEHRI